MMNEKLRFFSRCLVSPLSISALIILAAYWVATWFVPARTLIEFVDGLSIAFSAVVFFVYSGRFINSLCHKAPDVYDLLISGISGNWMVFGLDRGWRLISRVRDRPDMLDSNFIGYLLVVSVFCACLHLLVKGDADQGQMWRGVSTDAWRLISWTLLAGCVLGTTAVVMTWRFYD